MEKDDTRIIELIEMIKEAKDDFELNYILTTCITQIERELKTEIRRALSDIQHKYC